MPNVSLGQNGIVYASRAAANGAYMPDGSTVLNRNAGATTDSWGTAALSGILSSNGFVFPKDQDVNVHFVGNTGTGNIDYYDPVAAGWLSLTTISDALVHVVRMPGTLPVRIGTATATGTTALKMWTER